MLPYHVRLEMEDVVFAPISRKYDRHEFRQSCYVHVFTSISAFAKDVQPHSSPIITNSTAKSEPDCTKVKQLVHLGSG